jgi:hypothetical protein
MTNALKLTRDSGIGPKGEKFQQERLVDRGQPHTTKRGAGKQWQGDDVVMRSRGQIRQERQRDQHQSYYNAPHDVTDQLARVSDSPGLVWGFDRGCQRRQGSGPLAHPTQAKVDQDFAKSDVCEHTNPGRADQPNRSFERHQHESGQDKTESHSPCAIRHREATKSATASLEGGGLRG